ncbi:E3 ubiquitin-protein ligase ubr1 [Recurvomyces mirabilis]|uniref:E3 ubiquitin-protein ligase n=1 Tax=Recurvomyces mirabilis TaxID=574656 RepID=A0AAE0WFR7_9PEZI|nr:E3 ubiquitin-protein ligase ubr1 [Recurvomyces mirabilis]KAK5158572.1 E3 ubiquitin-protein ligase ubr1 [Recurvomyces mirabilis]
MLSPTTTTSSDQLCHDLVTHPSHFEYRYTGESDRRLRETLFRSLAANKDAYLPLFFPSGLPHDRSQPWSLKQAQGAEEGAEYTPAARGTACGHIFRSGESTYHCKTCAADATCVLCVRCFEGSEHDGHNVFVSVSPGNSGCCDCGDKEAWKREVRCEIHSHLSAEAEGERMGKEKKKAAQGVEGGSRLPPELLEAMHVTLGRVVDYLCDVFACSPEQLRLPKTEDSIQLDERLSRLGPAYGSEPQEAEPEYALVLWNDEKHTVDDVTSLVARACSKSRKFGRAIAMEVDEVGRSTVHYSKDIKELLRMAGILEQIKLTTTIRSARDTYREQMCSTIVDWISDISGCAVGDDAYVLRNIVCEEMLQPWQTGSAAPNVDVGNAGLDDHELEENEKTRAQYRQYMRPLVMQGQDGGVRIVVPTAEVEIEEDDDEDDGGGEEIEDEEDENDGYDEMDGVEVDVSDIREAANAAMALAQAEAADMDIDFMDDNEDVTEHLEATIAGYPPPPPPPREGTRQRRVFTPADSDDGEVAITENSTRPDPGAPYAILPKTPKTKGMPNKRALTRPSRHWLEKPSGFRSRPSEPCEDLWQRVRLDYLILYDLRLWKILRIHLRHLYITTVVTLPHFKRILGLRFAGLYTTLSQLYLIADREPDHSIINLSVQMLTTPSITEEVVERGNFFTNLMAILYTFLTTRQVGFPEDVQTRATLAFEAGAVTNRRIFHFFMDLRWLCQSELIHRKLRTEQRYLLQFLDLAKLHQGVCPNVRYTGEHVEYESDAWISASMIVKEVNRLCKQVAGSFGRKAGDDEDGHLQRALRTVAQVTMINSFGYERRRFIAAELKDDLAWHLVGPFEKSGRLYSVPRCRIQAESMSFHHPLHYLLSWLLEEGKEMSREEVRALLTFAPADLKDPWNVTRTSPAPSTLTSDELLSGILDAPLRTYVWLAQMKSGMWVRNGITLRHQAHTYRSVNHRDVGYQRDLLLIQTGLVLCGAETEKPGERYLAQMIDRFEMTRWFQGDYGVRAGFEEGQQLDVLEDFFHLLVVCLSERGNLVPNSSSSSSSTISASSGSQQHARQQHLQHDIAHALCFKPLSYSDLKNRVTDKVGDSEDFSAILSEMAHYRAPEGMSDTGTFELKPEFIELVDPYYAHYSRNHREEAEGIYKKYIASKSSRVSGAVGLKAEDVVFEPRLQVIDRGLFVDLAAFTRTELFAQVVSAALGFVVGRKVFAPKVQAPRAETFAHMVLHLVVLAVNEERDGVAGFVELAGTPLSVLAPSGKDGAAAGETVVGLLVTLVGMEEYSACHPTIRHILRKMQARQPEKMSWVGVAALDDRSGTASPASMVSAEDKGKKKAEALARQARVMAKMKEQQNSFMLNQGLTAFGGDDDDGEEDFEDLDDMSVTADDTGTVSAVEHRKTWAFPSGTCILCQEDTTDGERLYGTFAFLGESSLVRTTPTNDPDFVAEVLTTPASLDRSASDLRPFGVSGNNKQIFHKTAVDGTVTTSERQGLSKGFPRQPRKSKDPVATSCGHMMHFSCFEEYLKATLRRHTTQIARSHPERVELKEFICPLCKALGNTFLPIIWKPKMCAREWELHTAKSLGDWLLEADLQGDLSFLETMHADIGSVRERQRQISEQYSARSSRYVAANFAPGLVESLRELSLEGSSSAASTPRYSLRRGYSLSSLFRMGRRDSSPSDTFGSHASLLPHGGEPPRMAELMKAYLRVAETIRENNLCDPARILDGSVNPVSPLSRALGQSVASFEIAHRGSAGDVVGTSLLQDLSEQNLTHLRVLAETVESFLAVSVLRTSSAGVNIIAQDTVKRREILTAQLFGTETEIAMIKLRETGENLLFQDDIFLFFADWLAFMAPSVAEANSVLQLCYWAEIVKTVFVFKGVVKGLGDNSHTQEPVSEPFKLAVSGIAMEWDRFAMPLTEAQLQNMRVIVDKYALAFLRKAIVLMHVRYGLDYECPKDIKLEAPELSRLTALLHIPTIDDLSTLYTTSTPPSAKLRLLTKRWVSQATTMSEHEPTSITLSHPAIYELIGLPKNYDTLTSVALKSSCPTTGKELTDPAICLLCGAIFCSQAVCCMKDKDKGGCYQHMATCGGKIGLFINIRKCMVLFMHGPANGSWSHAPYLDRHGEPDPTLRKHHQLFLHQRRYDRLLREAWLGHGVPSLISRKLEADINPGGWETL